jgi:RES domain-containing protein
VRFAGWAYRAHDPRWAFKPLSGEGAALKGGRFNPKGVPALYLALTLEGAVVEASQGFAHKIEPLTICAYEIDCEDVSDLRTDETRSAAGAALNELACPWAYDVAEGRQPLSWRLAARLRLGGAAGILVPSFAFGARPDMVNLVLWTWSADAPHRVQVHDPSGRLPRDQTSWEGPPAPWPAGRA